MTTVDAQPSHDSGRFDALAAAAETSELAVLPSLIAEEDPNPEPDVDLITAQDLAHLTGDNGPAAIGWNSPPPPNPPAVAEANQGIDAPVSKGVVIPLVAVALAAVVFVAYSIVTASSTVRPDTVALIDRPTTTVDSPTTTEAQPTEPGVIGEDLAEQAAWLCSGDQFSIARAEAPGLNIYNDLVIATRDGQDDWSAPADHVTLQGAVPSLIGCLTTADGGEIDRCPSNGAVISRRSVSWTYRVLQSSDGATLGQDQGTASDVRSCDELTVEAADSDLDSWSPLPQNQLNQVAAAYTSVPHPQQACSALPDGDAAEPISFEQGASVTATFDGSPNTDVDFPETWRTTVDRPADVFLCLQNLGEGTASPAASPSEDLPEDSTTDAACAVTVRVHAMHRDRRSVGSWDHISSTCPEVGQTVTPPESWWVSVVGPALGYELEESETEGS